jgi:hypothetical protein
MSGNDLMLLVLETLWCGMLAGFCLGCQWMDWRDRAALPPSQETP